MSKLNRDLYNLLLNSPKVKQVIGKKITAKGGDLDVFWNKCEATANYYTSWNLMPAEENSEAIFLVFADYLTYVPYGTLGYQKFEELLKSSDANKSVAEYRFDKLKEIMGKTLTELPQEQIDYIKSFFENYNKEVVTLNNIPEVVSLICRAHHECEANYKTTGFANSMEISDRCRCFSKKLASLYDSQETLNASEILNEVSRSAKLTEAEVNYINETTGLGMSSSTKQP